MSLNEPPNLEQSALRLPTLSMTPSVDKLKEALRLASNNAQNIIELPWKSTNSPVNYMIKVTCQANPQEPAWILLVGGEGDDAILWNYTTTDCQMIHGLITAEVERAGYAAGGAPQAPAQPVPPPQFSAPSAPPPHLSQAVPAPSPPPPQVQKPAYDWGSSQSSSQGQDWSWSTPSPMSNANWSTSSHAPLPAPLEPIVPINDPQAFSQSWGAPSPGISSPDSGLQRNTKPPGLVAPESRPADNSIFSSNSFSAPPAPNPIPVVAPLSVPVSSPAAPLVQAQERPVQNADQLSQPAPVTPVAESPALPIGGFAHSTPFSMNEVPAVAPAVSALPVPPAAEPAENELPGVATLDSVPAMQESVLSDNNSPPERVPPLPVVPSGRKFSTTLSATLPLERQETLTPEAENLTSPQIDAADLPQNQPLELTTPVEEAPSVESASKDPGKKKGRGSRLKMQALKAFEAGEPAGEEPADVPVESVNGSEGVDNYAAPDVVAMHEQPVESPLDAPGSQPLEASISPAESPLKIDLASIPPLPAMADFAAPAIDDSVAPLPPPFVVEFDPGDASAAQRSEHAAAEELDPTVPLNIATGDDVENSRLLHQPPEAVADLAPSGEAVVQTEMVTQAAPEIAPEAVAEVLPEPVPAEQAESVASAPTAAAVASVEQKPPEAPPKRALPAPAPFNREAVDVIFKHLTNQETGFITNSAFMFFIVREFSRFQKAQTPITLIGFELALRAPDGAMYPVHLEALRECGRRFFSVMRPLDWLAHYSDDEYALLLPHTNIRESILLVKDLYTVLNQNPLLPGMEDAQVVMHCGISSIPEDCQHPGILIAAAYEAKNEAKRSNNALQLFRDMPA